MSKSTIYLKSKFLDEKSTSLVQSHVLDGDFSEIDEPKVLKSNISRSSYYQAVAKYVAHLSREGFRVELLDDTPKPEALFPGDAETLYAKVAHHPSGNRTLEISERKLAGYQHINSPVGLIANGNTVMFYRLVATYIALLSKEGHRVEYTDNSPSR